MKKLLFTLGLCLVAIAGFSQAKAELGLKGGLNFANVNADEVTGLDYESRTGYHFGVYSLIKVASFGIQPEVLYSVQGTTVNIDDLNEEFKSDFHYLNVPVMAKLYLPLGLNLQAGPQFGVLLSAESDGDDVKEEFKNADMSAALGAGWDAPFGLRINARYIIGLNDISEDGDSEVQNRVFQVSLGYKLFGLGK